MGLSSGPSVPRDTLELRSFEAALDRDGLSTTARAVLQRIAGRR
jgi:hypothetical protein